MQIETCNTCKYFKKILSIENIRDPQGTCKRHPPQCLPVGRQPNGQVAMATFCPTVAASDYCGEWRAQDAGSV